MLIKYLSIFICLSFSINAFSGLCKKTTLFPNCIMSCFGQKQMKLDKIHNNEDEDEENSGKVKFSKTR